MAVRISPAMLSLAAAHGLTPSVWQSWYPQLVRTPRVLVPIELEVLMVRDPEQRWADCGMKTPPPGTRPAACRRPRRRRCSQRRLRNWRSPGRPALSAMVPAERPR